jgi:glycine cleavage system H protein
MSVLKYTEEHEWLLLDEDNSLIVGISNYAQEQLGDVVYVELPEIGAVVGAGDEISVVESVKTAGEIKSPIGGVITEVNDRLADEPEIVNSDPLGDGWFFNMTPDDISQIEHFMDENAYDDYVKDL